VADLARKGARTSLPVRREPHWLRLDEGAYLGFLRGPDTWIARFRDGAGEQHYCALKVPVDVRDEFVEAKRIAEDWFLKMRGPASAKRGTVRNAVDYYLTHLERQGRQEAAHVARKRFDVILPDSDPLAHRKLESAKREDFERWRERLIPGRQPQSVNRYTDSMAAALNAALEGGHIGDACAWSLPPLTNDASYDEETAVFLSPAQRKALLAKAAPAAADFFRGLELTGARPGELARARVSDFDGEQIRFTHRKGRPPKLKTRYTVLSVEGAEFFKRVSSGKAPEEPLVGNPEGRPWPSASWGGCDAGRHRRASAVLRTGAATPVRRLGLCVPALAHFRVAPGPRNRSAHGRRSDRDEPASDREDVLQIHPECDEGEVGRRQGLTPSACH
jgi:integrase